MTWSRNKICHNNLGTRHVYYYFLQSEKTLGYWKDETFFPLEKILQTAGSFRSFFWYGTFFFVVFLVAAGSMNVRTCSQYDYVKQYMYENFLLFVFSICLVLLLKVFYYKDVNP